MYLVALRARIHREVGNWTIQTDASNAFNSVFRKPMLEQVAACTPVLTGFVANCYGERPASVFFQMGPGERTKLNAPRGCNKETLWDRLWSDTRYGRCLRGFGRNTSRRESKPMHTSTATLSIAADEISPGTVGAVPFLEREN